MPDEKRIVSTNYPGNANVGKEKPVKPDAKPEEKKLERVTTSDVIARKPSLGKRIAQSFSGEDMHSVGGYLLFDVALPALKNTISDMVSQGIERMLFGDSRPTSGRRTYTNYNRPSSVSRPPWERDREEPRSISRQARANHTFDEIVLPSRGEAEMVLDRLSDQIEKYDVATVSDLYELVGITGSFTDDKWGWTDLRSARVRQVREGYLLDLPRTGPIH